MQEPYNEHEILKKKYDRIVKQEEGERLDPASKKGWRICKLIA